jgi:hypothetical protein
MLYASLYCVAASFAADGAWLNVALMTPASVVTTCGAIVEVRSRQNSSGPLPACQWADHVLL